MKKNPTIKVGKYTLTERVVAAVYGMHQAYRICARKIDRSFKKAFISQEESARLKEMIAFELKKNIWAADRIRSVSDIVEYEQLAVKVYIDAKRYVVRTGQLSTASGPEPGFKSCRLFAIFGKPVDNGINPL